MSDNRRVSLAEANARAAKLLVVCSSLSGFVTPEVPPSAYVFPLMVSLLMCPYH